MLNLRGEHAVKITELEDKIDKLQKEIKAEKEKALTLESQVQQVSFIRRSSTRPLNFAYFLFIVKAKVYA